jgi:alpha-galactosidase
VEKEALGKIALESPAARFEIDSNGVIRAYLLKDGRRLSLDDPGGDTAFLADSVFSGGKEVAKPVLDLPHATMSDPEKSPGRRIQMAGRVEVSQGVVLEKQQVVEVQDRFPGLAILRINYRNAGSKTLALDKVRTISRHLNAGLTQPAYPPYDLWSFQGSSSEWGKDEILRLDKNFSRANLLGLPTPDGHGGGIPVVAFWNAAMGEAIGHLDPRPLAALMPVNVSSAGFVDASLSLEPGLELKPGESYSLPPLFIAVYQGDFYEPLSLYSQALQQAGWQIPRPTDQAYEISWCGWGYEFDVTPKQMLGIIPKLKELNIKWATLDDRWFDRYGDWEPRTDTFPDDSIKKMVEEYHRQGMLAQLWWLPLGVEDGIGQYPPHKYAVSKVVRDHPDWLILDQNGKHARMIRDLAVLCPALPEVREYQRQLTEKFIRDWDFDGHKLDNIYSAPPCYNPKHRHQSPMDSTYAAGEVYRVIFETTRRLKPQSVTQACPCGTTPNTAWLPFIDQAVTADPVGAVQVRRRIKMYKALLGPEAAVYGDHVELSEMVKEGKEWKEIGQDFASTIGTGGVPGTKFVWPDAGPALNKNLLTPDREAIWKKWISLYQEKMLSRGQFRNLYVFGYDVPEGYAIEKDGAIYYAFFGPEKGKPWKGSVELRGLKAGEYQVEDYPNRKALGIVRGRPPRLQVEFTDSLLLEVRPK